MSRKPDARQFDMFAVIEPPEPVQSIFRSQWEVAPIAERGDATEAKVESSYSAASLSSSGKVLRPFRFRGADWVNTGTSFSREGAEYECYRIVPEGEFAGPGDALTYPEHSFFGAHRDSLGGYHAMKAKLGSADVVLIGPPVVLVLKRQAA